MGVKFDPHSLPNGINYTCLCYNPLNLGIKFHKRHICACMHTQVMHDNPFVCFLFKALIWMKMKKSFWLFFMVKFSPLSLNLIQRIITIFFLLLTTWKNEKRHFFKVKRNLKSGQKSFKLLFSLAFFLKGFNLQLEKRKECKKCKF